MFLLNGTDAVPNQGRVEVLRSGVPTPVCASNFGPRAAAVVCRQLGFVGGVATVEPPNTFGTLPQGMPEAVYVRWGDSSCSEFSNSLPECVMYPTPDSCAMAAVTCSNSTGETLIRTFVQPCGYATTASMQLSPGQEDLVPTLHTPPSLSGALLWLHPTLQWFPPSLCA